MPRDAIFAVLMLLWLSPSSLAAQQPPQQVEVVATAVEYLPETTTVTHPGHSFTDCSGTTEYFGRFEPYTDSISGTATAQTFCSTTSYPASESTSTTYRRVDYFVVKSDRALILLSCSLGWVWSTCPSLPVGARYSLNLETTKSKKTIFGQALARELIGTSPVAGLQQVQLQGTASSKPINLSYVSAVALHAADDQERTVQSIGSRGSTEAKVQITSVPSTAEIFIDGVFCGNTPSTILLPTGEHAVQVIVGADQWSRTVKITSGEVTLHADLTSRLSPSEAVAEQDLSRFSSAFDAWKAACSAEHLSFQQCRDQVNRTKPALDQMHVQWEAVKKSLGGGPAPASARCREAWAHMLDSMDRYLSIQDKLYAMYDSVDPNSPNAASAWAAANAEYQVLQKQDHDGLEDVRKAAQRYSTNCEH